MITYFMQLFRQFKNIQVDTVQLYCYNCGYNECICQEEDDICCICDRTQNLCDCFEGEVTTHYGGAKLIGTPKDTREPYTPQEENY